MYYVYILCCADGSYYVGSTWNLQRRIEEHNAGTFQGYTSHRLPVELVWSCDFTTEHDAFLVERQLKGWSRARRRKRSSAVIWTKCTRSYVPNGYLAKGANRESESLMKVRILRLRTAKLPRCSAQDAFASFGFISILSEVGR